MWNTSQQTGQHVLKRQEREREREKEVIAAVAAAVVVTVAVAVIAVEAAAAAVGETKWLLAHKELSVRSRASLLWKSSLCKFVQAGDSPFF